MKNELDIFSADERQTSLGRKLAKQTVEFLELDHKLKTTEPYKMKVQYEFNAHKLILKSMMGL